MFKALWLAYDVSILSLKAQERQPVAEMTVSALKMQCPVPLQVCMHHKLDASHLPGRDRSDKMQLFLHLPIRQLPNGQPLLQVCTYLFKDCGAGCATT